MPNGYTAAIYDGRENFTLADYLMGVGRGMGFAVMQRDDDPAAPVKPVEPSDYHAKALAAAQERLADLVDVTPAQASERAESEYREALQAWEQQRETSAARRARYEDMLRQVEAWQPEPLVAGVKDYALKYLRESVEFDCGKPDDDMRWYPRPALLSGADWLASQRAAAEEDITRHAAGHANELARTAERNEWINAFLKSLPRHEAVQS